MDSGISTASLSFERGEVGMANLLVIGSLNMDIVVQVENIPVPGETVLGKSLQRVCGGKGANQAYTCGKLGGNVEMLGSVGQDDNGDALLENLRSVGVKTDFLQRTPVDTGLALIEVEASGNNSIVVAQGANLCTDAAYIEANRARIEAVDALVMQLEIPIEAVTLAAKIAKTAGKLVVLDPAPAALLPDELCCNVDIIKPNESELSVLTGLPVRSPEEAEIAARALLDRGIGTVVVTLGEEGAVVVSGERAVHYPGKPADAIDTTAAGDSFTAAMAMLLAQKYSLDEAVNFAISVSALVVTKAGAQSSIPSAEQVVNMLP